MPDMKNSKFTLKQKKFIEAYAKSHNATLAAKEAGYPIKQCEMWGKRLLNTPKVAEQIASPKNKEFVEHTICNNVTPDKIITELAAIAFTAISDLCEWNAEGITLKQSSALTREQTAAIAEIMESSSGRASVKIKMHAKLKALEMLGKHFGIFSIESTKQQDTEALKDILPPELLEKIELCFPDDDF